MVENVEVRMGAALDQATIARFAATPAPRFVKGPAAGGPSSAGTAFLPWYVSSASTRLARTAHRAMKEPPAIACADTVRHEPGGLVGDAKACVELVARPCPLGRKTAWFMTHRIRTAMAGGSFMAPMGGAGQDVEADETYHGKKAVQPTKDHSGRPFTKRGAGVAAAARSSPWSSAAPTFAPSTFSTIPTADQRWARSCEDVSASLDLLHGRKRPLSQGRRRDGYA